MRRLLKVILLTQNKPNKTLPFCFGLFAKDFILFVDNDSLRVCVCVCTL